MLLKWFDAREAKRFGADLATFFASQVPLEAKDLKEKKFVARTQSALKQMNARIGEFRQREALNLYTRAQLGNAFKWALRDAGYAQAYVDELTEWVVAQL